MKTPSKTLLSFCAIVFLALASHASANLVVNNGFETGDFSAWTNSGGGNGFVVPLPNSGAFAAGFSDENGDGGFHFLSQNIATTAGTTYDLSFFMTAFAGKSISSTSVLSGPLGISAQFQVFWGGVMIFDTTNPPINDYNQFSVSNLLATGASTELQFAFENGFVVFLLDDVVLNEASGQSVPDNFSTLWLALPLIGMFGFAHLRRKPIAAAHAC